VPKSKKQVEREGVILAEVQAKDRPMGEVLAEIEANKLHDTARLTLVGKRDYMNVTLEVANVRTSDYKVNRPTVFASARLVRDVKKVFIHDENDVLIAYATCDNSDWFYTILNVIDEDTQKAYVNSCERSTSKRANDKKSIDSGPDCMIVINQIFDRLYTEERKSAPAVQNVELNAKVEELKAQNEKLLAILAEKGIDLSELLKS
jgi:hypothetical protein